QVVEIKKKKKWMKLPCIESRPVIPIPQEWLDSIDGQIPPQLKDSPQKNKLLYQLLTEVSDNFHDVIIKYTVDSFLKDPECEEPAPEKQTILEFSQTRRENFVTSRKLMRANLHILHPIMQTVLEIGHTTFSSMSLVDLTGYRALGPVDGKVLHKDLAVECETAEEQIMNTWFPKVINLLTSPKTLGSVKDNVMDAFFDCACTLISNQLKALIQRSVEGFVYPFHPDNYHVLPIFHMSLTFNDEQMGIYPTLQELEADVFEILNKVQTVQSWLADSTSAFVDAKAPDHTLAWAHCTLTTTLRKNLEEPDRYFQNYVDNYDWLLNGAAQAQVETFLEETHSFVEYVQQVEEFRELSRKLGNFPTKVHFPMVQLHCEGLNQGLAKKAQDYAEILIRKMKTKHTQLVLQICSDFETIRRNALKVPETTDDMAQIIDYIETTKTQSIALLHEKIKSRLSYLLDVHIFEPEDLELNSTVFMWPLKIQEVFKLSDEALREARMKGEKEMFAKRERVTIHLAKLERRVDEFPHCSELDMMQQYLTEVRTVQKLLQEAEETISDIHKDEVFHQWEQTSYPEVEVIRDSVEQYQKFRWMDGSFADLDGEGMEVKLDEFFREIFKMLKHFQQKKSNNKQDTKKTTGLSRQRRSVEDTNKNQSPSILCSTTLEEVKEFKVSNETCVKSVSRPCILTQLFLYWRSTSL
uniref:Dynein heavy chain linker domain-containing protein n=1 Tax=Hippocampus comes TaxID=109280 RepID=A0A3Q2XVH1_HIPCM